MLDLDRWFSRQCNRWCNRPIVALIHIKHVHSSISYQWTTYQIKYTIGLVVNRLVGIGLNVDNMPMSRAFHDVEKKN